MQGYGGAPGGPPGGHPAQQLYPYMYAPQSGQPNAMYGAPPGMQPYPIAPSQSSHYMSSPYGIPAGMPPSQPIIPQEGRMPRPRRFTDRSKPREERGPKPLKSAMKKSNSLSVQPSGQSPYREGSGLNLWRSRTQRPKTPFPEGEEEEEIRMRHPRKERPVSNVPSSGGVLARTRTLSDPHHPRSRTNSFTRPRSRTNGLAFQTPGHLLVQISGTNRLFLSSLMFTDYKDDIRERVLTMWPDGVDSQIYTEETHEYDVHFTGSPWTSKGNLGLIAMRLILELFTLLARRGYVCTSSIDTGLSTGYPRLIFSATKPDQDVEFFMIIFSNNRRKIKFINHPDHLGQTICDILREQFPRRVTNAGWDDSDMYKIELNRWDSDSTAGLALAGILQQCTTEGYKLECTIPLIHAGLFGALQGKKELWIMKRLPQYTQN